MLLYIGYRVAQALVLMLPVRFSYGLASRIADLHYYTSKKDRKIVVNNLKKLFGKDNKETRRVAKDIFRNFAEYLVEFLRFQKMGKDYIERHVEIEGIENLKRALEQNRGATIFSAHLGNWEWGAAIVAQLGFPMNVIALAHKDKRVNNFFIQQRTMKGIKNIPLGGSVRKSLSLLAKNEAVAILSDRDFSNNSIPVKFFGETALMPIGIGVLAIKSSSPLVPVFIIRQKDETHKLIIERPLEYSLTGNNEEDIKNIVQETTKIIEKYVNLYPEQWFMFADPWEK